MANKLFGALIDETLIKKVKIKIAQSGTTITKVLTELLTQWVK